MGAFGVVAACLLRCVYAPTEMVLDIRTDLDCARDTPRTRIRVGDQTVAETSTCTPTSDGRSSIGTMTIVPSGDRDARATLEVIVAAKGTTVDECAALPANCVSARRAFSYLAHESRRLPVDLQRACLGRLCPSGETCLDGACVKIDVACEGDDCDVPENLPSRRAARGEGGTDGSGGLVGGSCVAGEYRCDGAVLLGCASNELAQLATCASPKLCALHEGDRCRDPVCAVGETKCVGQVFFRCSQGRDELAEAARCAGSTQCAAGSGCVPKTTSCTPGEAHCDFSCLRSDGGIPTTNDCRFVCNGAGTGFTDEDCGYAQGQTSQSCTEPTSGTAYCHLP